MGNRIHMRAVERAAQIAHGDMRLAMYLGVSPFLVHAWIEGKTDVPPAMFLKIVDIIVDYSGAQRGAIPTALVEAFKHRQAANG
jgi:hypothetical protein